MGGPFVVLWFNRLLGAPVNVYAPTPASDRDYLSTPTGKAYNARNREATYDGLFVVDAARLTEYVTTAQDNDYLSPAIAREFGAELADEPPTGPLVFDSSAGPREFGATRRHKGG